jgi:NAD(P)-dependent dehydrogenase (short-subunit alcohol dehydrogenase family)
MRLPSKTVIVTGGAAGIGATYSAGLVQEGAVVYIADIADGSSLAAELTGCDRAVPFSSAPTSAMRSQSATWSAPPLGGAPRSPAESAHPKPTEDDRT